MQIRSGDGSAGDADYAAIGRAYARYRRPDPRIAAQVSQALGGARTVLNVGAGAGSYEPADRQVTPVEPSASMRAQRPASLPAAVDATAENLPFPDGAFDAAMTTFSVHQWGDLQAGLRELRRVTRGPVVILTCDPQLLHRFWLTSYAPEVIDDRGPPLPRDPGPGRRAGRLRRHHRGAGTPRLHGRIRRGVLRPPRGAPGPGCPAGQLSVEFRQRCGARSLHP